MVVGSPEVPKRCLEACKEFLYSSSSLARYIIQPEVSDNKDGMLLVLDIDRVSKRILSQCEESPVEAEQPLPGSDTPLQEVV